MSERALVMLAIVALVSQGCSNLPNVEARTAKSTPATPMPTEAIAFCVGTTSANGCKSGTVLVLHANGPQGHFERYENHDCSVESMELTEEECKLAGQAYGIGLHSPFTISTSHDPKGCFRYDTNNQLYFNKHSTGAPHNGRTPYCKRASDFACGNFNTLQCPDGYGPIVSETQCKKFAQQGNSCGFVSAEPKFQSECSMDGTSQSWCAQRPKGCFQDTNGAVIFNAYPSGTAYDLAASVCAKEPDDLLTPTMEPTSMPTPVPTNQPSAAPTLEPTSKPTANPTTQSAAPTLEPTPKPTPTKQPTVSPTTHPTTAPTAAPTTPFKWAEPRNDVCPEGYMGIQDFTICKQAAVFKQENYISNYERRGLGYDEWCGTINYEFCDGHGGCPVYHLKIRGPRSRKLCQAAPTPAPAPIEIPTMPPPPTPSPPTPCPTLPPLDSPSLKEDKMFSANKNLGNSVELKLTVGFVLDINPSECLFEAQWDSGTIHLTKDGITYEFNPAGVKGEASGESVDFTMSQGIVTLTVTFTKKWGGCCYSDWDVTAQVTAEVKFLGGSISKNVFDNPKPLGSVTFDNCSLCPGGVTG